MGVRASRLIEGNANWDYIKACKQAAKKIKVIGNGDLFDADAALRMFAHTGCDAVLVSRGTMGQPWIAEDIARGMQGQDPIARTFEDARQALMEHFEHTLRYHTERQSLIEMRRVGCWYLKKSSGTKGFREKISKASDIHNVRELISTYSFEEENERRDCGDACEG